MSDNASTRSFNQFLGELEDGRLHDALTRHLREMIEVLVETDAAGSDKPKGEIAVTFKFAAEDGMIEVTGAVKVKHPLEKRGRSIFYATPENNLTRRHPNQAELPLRDVSAAPAAPTRDVLA